LSLGRGGGERQSEQGAGFFQLGRALCAPQPIGADFDKAFWQHVAEEASDKFLGAEAQVFDELGTVVAVSERDLAVFERFV